MTDLHENRIAVVTGAATGIGQAIAMQLARDGAKVALADIADLSETLALIGQSEDRAIAVTTDVTSPDAVADLSATVQARLGHPSILVNDAGLHRLIPWDDLTLETWHRFFSVNLDSQFLLCKAFVPGMRQAGWGRIINIASSQLGGGHHRNQVHYIATKGAVVGLTGGLANDLGDDGITVNAVAPGLTGSPQAFAAWQGTEMFEREIGGQAIRRLGRPEDIADIVSFLASQGARWITGQTIHASGGAVRT
ncbi:MAG: SDR family oxidoreductase [Devosia sp.]|nr:SDR family oxidoreductase [Devosia sp.]